jgi:hypothetical protein
MKWIAIFMMLISFSAFADDDHHFPMDMTNQKKPLNVYWKKKNRLTL